VVAVAGGRNPTMGWDIFRTCRNRQRLWWKLRKPEKYRDYDKSYSLISTFCQNSKLTHTLDSDLNSFTIALRLPTPFLSWPPCLFNATSCFFLIFFLFSVRNSDHLSAISSCCFFKLSSFLPSVGFFLLCLFIYLLLESDVSLFFSLRNAESFFY
jgi:hypothetical protein